jgi:hypothetical protein
MYLFIDLPKEDLQPTVAGFMVFNASYLIRAITTANNATPSIRAAEMIIAVCILLVASGCLAIASMAEPPIRPIPNPAPIAARPAPTAANVPVIIFILN